MDELPEYRWTVEQWTLVTRDWTELSREIVRIARKYPYEERVKRGSELFENRDRMGDPMSIKYAEFVSDLWSLPDDVIDRVIRSFD